MLITWDLPVYGRLCRILMEILVDFYMRIVKNNNNYYLYFYVPNRRKITINAYESMGRYKMYAHFYCHEEIIHLEFNERIV
jgi:hypothetical protein